MRSTSTASRRRRTRRCGSRACCKRLGRLAAPGATAATWSTARIVRDALAAADFSVQRAGGFRSTSARCCGRAARAAASPRRRRPGAATSARAIRWPSSAPAWPARRAPHALAQLGVRSRVIDAHRAVAEGASASQPACCTAWCTTTDSPHTRWFRAGALRAHATIAPLVASGAVRGALRRLAAHASRPLDRRGDAAPARCAVAARLRTCRRCRPPTRAPSPAAR